MAEDILSKGSTSTPTAHAATHASGGSDPVTLAESQITNLTTDLAAKAALASPTFTGTPSLPTGTTGVTQSAGDGSTKLATTAYADRIAQGVGAPNTQTASYTLALGDAGKAVEMNAAGATTLTIPTNATVAFPIGTVIEVARLGAGGVTIAAAGGVTLRSAGSKVTLASQYSVGSLRKRATDEWVLGGDLA